ncbi:hypothetical protein K388_02715 [Streptomyces sp. KhCrAH-43]|uniref:hypothetical protein n=1 Tax=unclassified Streptomyces TaxID=2593676 RepID=UPI000373B8F9|nr:MULTISPECIES: hypothetical protein [unclassified Streptomyces]MYS36706.1 hypothetical protein [Streptomyces sp. SID4920]MYX69177.1 hypothetical protein [Streptomyces sp. SID8373]RAJ62029.1 hypothetical protein K388_02715 [Streptomyces sp. KhCrAH-43]
MAPPLAHSASAGLARQIDALVAEFPAAAAEVSVADLLDDIGMLNHYLQYIAEHMQERFANPDDVGLVERTTLCETAEAAGQIAQAQHHLTTALTYMTSGFRKELMLHSHPHLADDPGLALTIATEKYGEAADRLRKASHWLDSTARTGQRPSTAPPRPRSSPAASTLPARR